MKLLHTSDWHLGMVLRGGMSYAKDQEYAIQGLIRIAKEEQADGILLAGDVFDKSIASPEAIRLYDRVMTEICVTQGIPVYMIAGNHDGAERLAQCGELMKAGGLYVAGALSRKPYVVHAEDADLYLLPWISTDKVRSVFPERADEVSSMEDAYRIVLDACRETFEAGRKHILVAHAFIVNAQTSVSDRAAEVGQAAMVGSGLFDGFDYVALGHLHGPQQIRENIRYSGSLMAYSFGREEQQEKSVTIVDTDTLEQKIVPIPRLRRRTTLTGTCQELMAAEYPEDIRNGYVRLEVTDSYVGLDTIAAFRERYPNLLEVSGKTIDREDGRITITIEELEQIEQDPESVFFQYCRDIMEEAPGEHLLELFREACQEVEKEESEA